MAHRASGWLLAVLASTVAVAPGAAQPSSFAIAVSFEINVPRIESAWLPEEMKEVKSILDDHLVAVFEQRFPVWYQDFPLWTFAPDGAASPVLLDFRVVESERGEEMYDLRLEGFVHDVPSPGHVFPLRKPWYEAGDLSRRGVPMPQMTINEVIPLANALIDENKHAINDWLQQHVPVARGAHWHEAGAAGEPLLVLPLKWDEYDRLRLSEFWLRCFVPSTGELRLDGNAIGLPGRFEAATESYEAVMMKLTQPDPPPRLPDDVLQESAVYITRFEPPGWGRAPSRSAP